jgi:hypothetical protein
MKCFSFFLSCFLFCHSFPSSIYAIINAIRYYEVNLLVSNNVAQIGFLDFEFCQRITSHGVV